MNKHALMGLVVCATMGGAAAAGPLEDGFSAYRHGYYVTALEIFQKLADQGDAKAATTLGSMFANGQGVPPDMDEARRWFLRAAEKGEPAAQFNLGILYYTGQGVPKDYAAAFQWYRRAAAQGYAEAEYNLGLMYAGGLSVPQNYLIAHVLFSLAATQGYENARKSRDVLVTKMDADEIALAQLLRANSVAISPSP